MTPQQIHARLVELAAARFGRTASELLPDDDFFDTLGIDSFQAMELVSELETAFAIEVMDYELQGVTTFRALGEVIARRL